MPAAPLTCASCTTGARGPRSGGSALSPRPKCPDAAWPLTLGDAGHLPAVPLRPADVIETSSLDPAVGTGQAGISSEAESMARPALCSRLGRTPVPGPPRPGSGSDVDDPDLCHRPADGWDTTPRLWSRPWARYLKAAALLGSCSLLGLARTWAKQRRDRHWLVAGRRGGSATREQVFHTVP